MTIPKKGSRRIIVDEVKYRWAVRRKPTYMQLIWGGLSFAVELATDEPSSTLIVHTTYDRPDSIGNQPAIIRPHDVAEAIRSALKAGWNPQTNTKPFHHSANVGEPIQ